MVADLIVDRANEAPALQPRQRPDLLCRPRAGIRQLNPAERHVLPANPEGHVSAGVGGSRERHRQISPQQPLQFRQALIRRPGDQAGITLLSVRRIPGHQHHDPPALAGAPGRDDAQVIAERGVEHQLLRQRRILDFRPCGCCWGLRRCYCHAPVWPAQIAALWQQKTPPCDGVKRIAHL